MNVTAVAVMAAASAGIASSVHCAAMCGPLAAFAGRDARAAATYHAARLLAYALVGALAGATGTRLADLVSARWAGALASWSLAAALAFTAWRLWRGSERRPKLVRLGRERRPSWSSRLFARAPRHPAVVGAITALLPCGALYAALFIAVGSYSALGGALSMSAFALTSAVGLGLVGALAARARQRLRRGGPTWWGRAFASALIVGAVLLVVRPIDSLRDDAPAACHAP